jgi:hypothetical protein
MTRTTQLRWQRPFVRSMKTAGAIPARRVHSTVRNASETGASRLRGVCDDRSESRDEGYSRRAWSWQSIAGFGCAEVT